MKRLSIWPRVVFVDWHGVLSKSQFWFSIPKKRKDSSALAARNVRAALFDRASPDLNAWMRGQISTSSIVETHGQIPSSSVPDVTHSLRLRLEDECRRAPLNQSLLTTLRHLGNQANVVIATDNMDFFSSVAWTRPDIRALADDILSSADVGALKSDDPDLFFGPYLRQAGASWRDAVLIDDSARNCAKFELHGGRAIRIDRYEDASATVAAALSNTLIE